MVRLSVKKRSEIDLYLVIDKGDEEVKKLPFVRKRG